MAIFGALLLVFVVYIRPQEFIPELASLALLNVATGLTVVGVAIDLGRRRIRDLATPQWPWLIGFAGWCVLASFVKLGSAATDELKTTLLFPIVFMLVIMWAARSFGRFRALATLLVLIALWLSTVCAYQGSTGFQCIELAIDPETGAAYHDESLGTPDGRSCEDRHECEKEGKGGEYVCEKPGLFHTFTVGHGRVRWRGTLADPNELSLAIGCGIAFVFAMHARARRAIRHVLLAMALAVAVYCVIRTSSRGGVLVLLVIFGVYFYRRFGGKGLLIAAVCSLPLILLGGRSGEEAEASATERIGALYEGIDFFKSSPLFGLGLGEFARNYFITAHNSYLLAASELGLPGMWLWSMLMYVSMKIAYVVGHGTKRGVDANLVPFAFALLVAFSGMLIGIFFLSMTYHPLVFIYFGLAGALFGAARQTVPNLQIKVSGKEMAYVLGVDVAILTWLFVYTRIKGSG